MSNIRFDERFYYREKEDEEVKSSFQLRRRRRFLTREEVEILTAFANIIRGFGCREIDIICVLVDSGFILREPARRFGISPITVGNIAKRLLSRFPARRREKD